MNVQTFGVDVTADGAVVTTPDGALAGCDIYEFYQRYINGEIRISPIHADSKFFEMYRERCTAVSARAPMQPCATNIFKEMRARRAQVSAIATYRRMLGGDVPQLAGKKSPVSLLTRLWNWLLARKGAA